MSDLSDLVQEYCNLYAKDQQTKKDNVTLKTDLKDLQTKLIEAMEGANLKVIRSMKHKYDIKFFKKIRKGGPQSKKLKPVLEKHGLSEDVISQIENELRAPDVETSGLRLTAFKEKSQD